MSDQSKNSFHTNITVTLPMTLDRFWIAKTNLLSQKPENTLIIDLTKTTRIDSAGYCFIRLLHTMYEQAGKKLIIRNLAPELQEPLQSWTTTTEECKVQPENDNFFVRIGNTAISFKENVLNALSVLTEMIYWGTLGLFKKRDFKRGAFGEQMYLLGYKAFGIVGLLSFLIGIVLALQTAMQLETFGAGIFLAPLIGITMVRELGPLLTAIILAGRTGSATTAEIATMVVGEELDALQTMGINSTQYVVVPKFWAISITMPILSIMATAAGIFGGFLITVFYLDLSSSLYWNELAKSIQFRDFWAGFVKSIIFSWLIIWIGSFYGFRVRGGAEAVGKETTASVVTGIFIIILADALFSFIL
ncbi:MAG TPA: MlaE family lipid ABC transporter permease subunit [Chitinispirillaceae bacterium]|nr:MlaE family lipid ABC transporter permease subunit [Chitinispirillaceae bacterium]